MEGGNKGVAGSFKELAMSLSTFQSGVNPVLLAFEKSGYFFGVVSTRYHDFKAVPDRHPEPDVSSPRTHP